jgi:hypothetical protein
VANELREFKFVVQPILAVFEDDELVGESTVEPIVLYGIKGLQEFIERFPVDLEKLNNGA